MNSKKQCGKGPIKKLHRVSGSRLRKQSSATKVFPRHAVDHEDNAWLKTKVRKINEALDRDPVDVDCLRKLALSEYGFVTDDIRCRVWPKLLNVNIFNLPKRSRADIEQKEFRKNKYFQQVKLDIDRSQRRFPSGTRASRRRVLQDQLTNIIMRTLCRNPELHYYQGYHDVAVTLLRVVGEDLAMALLEQLSLHHIRDFMDVNMERTNKMLALIHPILSKMDKSLGDFIQRAEVGQIFALSWLITWFGHNLERFSVIVRLFDVFIATNPFMPIYVGAAIIESDVENVMELDCEMSTVHSYLSKLPNGLILEETEYIISKAYSTYLVYPPNILQRTAKYIVSQSSSVSSHKQLVERSMMQKPDTMLRKRTRLRNFISDEPKQSAGFEEALEKDAKGLEATCWKDKAVDLLHPSCCRELIFTVPDILVSPCHASSDKLYIIVKRETMHDEMFLHTIQRLKIKIEQQFDVHREVFQYCLNFTLIHRVAPLWNRLGGFLVRGKKFFQETCRLDAIRFSIAVTSQICLSLRAFQVKLPACEVRDFCSRLSVLERFAAQSDIVIDGSILENNSCILLPSTKRGWLASITKAIPKSSPFQDYCDLRQHWKLMYGIHLPAEGCSEFYNVASFGGNVYTYPSYCIRSCEPVIFTRCNNEDIMQSFMRDFVQRMPTLCGIQARFSSSTLFPVVALCEAKKSKHFLSTKAKLKQFNRLDLPGCNNTSTTKTNIDAINRQEPDLRAPKRAMESKGDRIVPCFGNISRVGVESKEKECVKHGKVDDQRRDKKLSGEVKGKNMVCKMCGKTHRVESVQNNSAFQRKNCELVASFVSIKDKLACCLDREERKSSDQDLARKKMHQTGKGLLSKNSASTKQSWISDKSFDRLQQRKRKLSENSTQREHSMTLPKCTAVQRCHRQISEKSEKNTSSTINDAPETDRRMLAIKLAQEVLLQTEYSDDTVMGSSNGTEESPVEEEAAPIMNRNLIAEKDFSSKVKNPNTAKQQSNSRKSKEIHGLLHLNDLKKVSVTKLRLWLKEKKIKVKVNSKKEELITQVQELLKIRQGEE